MKLAVDSKIKDDLGGVISLKFKNGTDLNVYCSKNINNFDPDNYEVLAIRVFYGKEILVTVYAVDNNRMEQKTKSNDKIQVKKFKLGSEFLPGLLPLIEEGNFTLTTGNYNMDDMEVVNK